MGEVAFLQALVDNPPFIDAVVERTADAFIEQNDAYFAACADDVDIYFFGSDFGTQRSLFISPNMYRRFFKPHMQRIVQHAKRYGVHAMYHTCGAVTEIIPDLIETGVDALDPVQVSALGMEPANLAAKFGGRIAFHGGISIQKLLPCASAEEVYETTLETIRALGPSGYIAGPDQYMIGDIPTENIAAMYRAVRDYQV
jgi:uroporphyrinogen decarboxylase